MFNNRKFLALTLALLATLFLSSATLAAENAMPNDKNLWIKDLVGSWQGSNDVLPLSPA